MDNTIKLKLHKYSILMFNKIVVFTFEFTGAARGFIIISCTAREGKKVEQHCFKVSFNLWMSTFLIILLLNLWFRPN